MADFLTALALVMVIEGVIWCVAPESMRRMAAAAATIDVTRLRAGGLMFAAVGVLGVWLIRG